MVAPVLPALFTVHTMVWLVAVAGDTVPVRLRGIFTEPVVGTSVMPVTAVKVVVGRVVPGIDTVPPPSTGMVPAALPVELPVMLLIVETPPVVVVATVNLPPLVVCSSVRLLPSFADILPELVWVTPDDVILSEYESPTSGVNVFTALALLVMVST
jgi:hypothetical protein